MARDEERAQELLGELLEALQDLPPEERLSWLEGAREGITPRVLSVDDATREWSTRPPIADDATLPGGGPVLAHRGRPEAIGPYRLLELLGEGGMGQVYLAEQREPIERRVAIKLISSMLPGSRDLVRFEAERQAVARMSHPHIAQVHEAGSTPTGLPYLVMEYVPGETITDYCERRDLDLQTRLKVFLQVASGVAHAHRKGVLHRDLKPSNVLVTEVDGEACAKLIDFGIAKNLTDAGPVATRLTREGAMVGTPGFLPPEVILDAEGGDPDLRGDVYALGAILYQLLVGELPFFREEDSLITWIQRVSDEEVRPPSRLLDDLPAEVAEERAKGRSTTLGGLRRQLRGDLDGIVLKALAKKRDDRYESVAELAADIERFRRNEPVQARTPSHAYLFWKLAQRHKGWVAAALLLLFSLSFGLALRTREAHRANREAERANREAAAAREVADFLGELFSVADPSESRGNTVTARELLDRGAERLRTELVDQPATRARLLEEIGGVYNSLGLHGEAEELLLEALEYRRQHPEEGLALASTLHRLGLAYYNSARHPEAEKCYLEALEIHRRELGEEHRRTADSLALLGDLYELEGKNAKAEEYLRQALDIRERILEANDPDLAESYERLGVVLSHGEDQTEAERWLSKALDIRQRVLGEDHPKVALSLNNLAIARAQGGDLEGGRDLFRQALKIRQKILPEGHPDLGQSLYNVGVVEEMLGETESALDYLRQAGETWSVTLGEENPRSASVWHRIAEIETSRGNLERAEQDHRKGLLLMERSLGSDALRVSHSLMDVAGVVAERGRLEEARDLYRRALGIRTASLPADAKEIEESRQALASIEAKIASGG